MEASTIARKVTNELEVLEFTLNGNYFGINVAKVREIINYVDVTPVPNSHPNIEGVFMPRDVMITAIDLKKSLGLGESEKGGVFILTNFNNLDMAFHADNVIGIKRVSLRDVIEPDNTISANDDSVTEGVIKDGNKLIVVLDFERIIGDINLDVGLNVAEIEESTNGLRDNLPILVVEDSAMLTKLLVEGLNKAGYKELMKAENGQQAWEIIESICQSGNVEDKIKCVVTDLEMPVMDGHSLIKQIRENNFTKNLPIVIFTSIVNEDIRKQGEELGANVQLSKPEIGELIHILDELLIKE